jgi:hypothetical protein
MSTELDFRETNFQGTYQFLKMFDKEAFRKGKLKFVPSNR